MTRAESDEPPPDGSDDADEGDYVALVDGDQLVKNLLWLTELGCYDRSDGEWKCISPDDGKIDFGDLDAFDVDSGQISALLPLWDTAEKTAGTMTLNDVLN